MNPNNENKFPLLKLLVVIAIVAIVASFTLPRKAKAQPYYTNLNQGSGAQVYNQAYPTPLQPSKVLGNQYAAGTLAGYIGTNSTPFYLVTNSFSTNIFSTPPFVVCTADINGLGVGAAAGPPASNTVTVVSVTVTNFVVQTQKTNDGIYWEATGH